MTRIKNKGNLTRAYYARVDSDPPACSHSVPNTIRFENVKPQTSVNSRGIEISPFQT